MRYEVDSTDFAVRIYDDNNVNFWYQPQYPNGDTFDSYEEAETWAQAALNSQNPEYGFLAPIGKNIPAEPKPTPQQIVENKLAKLGISADDLKTLLGL